jgi:hypothetical protein
MYDSKSASKGLYLSANGQSLWLPKAAVGAVELLPPPAPAEPDYEEGAAYQDAAGDVYLRLFADTTDGDPWIDADGDKLSEDYPLRPLTRLSAPATAA